MDKKAYNYQEGFEMFPIIFLYVYVTPTIARYKLFSISCAWLNLMLE